MTIHGELVIHTISIHSLRMEGDIRFDEILNPKWAFQSTPSAWRETESRGVLSVSERFQSTPSAWRETRTGIPDAQNAAISIHSLRMEGDEPRLQMFPGFRISIHSLRMEGDREIADIQTADMLFQSTPSAWRETSCRQRKGVCYVYFNPLPPHGGRQLVLFFLMIQLLFQSTPSAWRETSAVFLHAAQVIFQSTPSAWRETFLKLGGSTKWKYFNPLPPHGGRPGYFCGSRSCRRYFNPLPPHGGRLSCLVR